jgi:hypothetical protein
MTFIEAAPARPTLIVTGLTRAERAKFCIFFGIVAENSRVCLCPCATIKSCNLGKAGGASFRPRFCTENRFIFLLGREFNKWFQGRNNNKIIRNVYHKQGRML